MPVGKASIKRAANTGMAKREGAAGKENREMENREEPHSVKPFVSIKEELPIHLL